MAKCFYVPCRKSERHAASEPHKGNVGSQAGDCLMHHLFVGLTTMESHCYLLQTQQDKQVRRISTICQPLK